MNLTLAVRMGRVERRIKDAIYAAVTCHTQDLIGDNAQRAVASLVVAGVPDIGTNAPLSGAVIDIALAIIDERYET